MKVYPNISNEEIERQYYLRGTRPDYETTLIPDWIKRSNRLLEKYTGLLDLNYGKAARNSLDFFSGSDPKGHLMLYIHGGYWQRGDKSVYRFIAEPFLDQGISVALINYPMCPTVTISQITEHVRLAVSWLWSNSQKLGFCREKINIIGHSAGGHLTAEMMMTDWPAYNTKLPETMIQAGVALSGVYDLEPLLYCSENRRLKLDKLEVMTASPMRREISTLAPMLISYGYNEPDDMHRQSIEFYNAFKPHCDQMQCLCIQGADHFDTVNVLANQNSQLFADTLEMLFI